MQSFFCQMYLPTTHKAMIELDQFGQGELAEPAVEVELHAD